MSLKELNEVMVEIHKNLVETKMYTEEVGLIGKMLAHQAEMETYNNIQVTQMQQFQIALASTPEGKAELERVRKEWAEKQAPGSMPMPQQSLDKIKRERMKKLQEEDARPKKSKDQAEKSGDM